MQRSTGNDLRYSRELCYSNSYFIPTSSINYPECCYESTRFTALYPFHAMRNWVDLYSITWDGNMQSWSHSIRVLNILRISSKYYN